MALAFDGDARSKLKIEDAEGISPDFLKRAFPSKIRASRELDLMSQAAPLGGAVFPLSFRQVSVAGDASAGLKNASGWNADPPSRSVRNGSGIIVARHDAIDF